MLLKWCRRRINSKKAAATLRRLLTVDEKDFSKINIEIRYEKSNCDAEKLKEVADKFIQELKQRWNATCCK